MTSTTHLFLTGTLRCYNTDFFQWLYNPHAIRIVKINAKLSQSSSSSKNYQLFYQAPNLFWDQMNGVPVTCTSKDQQEIRIKSSVPWHCVMMAEDSSAPKESSIEGDIISIDTSTEIGKELLEELKSDFFQIVNDDTISNNSSSRHSIVKVEVEGKQCLTFVFNNNFENEPQSQRWIPVPNNSYHSNSEFPSLPLPRRQRQSNNKLPHNHLHPPIPKTIIVILDGAGDSHSPSVMNSRDHNNKTPLERACELSPGLSVFTRNGFGGMMDPFEPGFACGSDTAHLNLFGFPPHLWYRGRGAFESLGAGMTMIPGRDIAFKSNFATIASDDEEKNVVLRRRCDRNFVKEGPVMCDALDGMEIEIDDDDAGGGDCKRKYLVKVKYATEHRCGVGISGPDLSDKITGTDPLVDNKPLVKCTPTITPNISSSEYKKALLTCKVVEAVSDAMRNRLSNHPINKERVEKLGKPPANVVLLRGAAQTAPNPSFAAVHGSCFCGYHYHHVSSASPSSSSLTSTRCFAIAPTCIISGFAKSIGMTDATEKYTKQAIALGATGDVHSNLDAKAQVCLDAMFHSNTNNNNNNSERTHKEKQEEEDQNHHQFAIVHVKGCDDAGHDGHPDMKAQVLAKGGKVMQSLWDGAAEGTVFAVFADHSTPCVHLDHGCDPVPVSVAVKSRKREKKDGCQFYSETGCANGSLGRFRGSDLMKILKTMMLAELYE